MMKILLSKTTTLHGKKLIIKVEMLGILLLCPLLLEGCLTSLLLLTTISEDHSHDVYLHNDSPYCIIGTLTHGPFFYVYPDTTLRSRTPLEVEPDLIIEPHTHLRLASVGVPRNDTLCLFIFNADTLSTYPWNQIVREYKVCARYDIPCILFRKGISSMFYYPPRESYKDIHMWPSYETILKQVEDYESVH